MRRSTASIIALGASLTLTPARASAAQEPTARPPATVSDTTTKRAFDIPPQPLSSALDRFREQSGLIVESSGIPSLVSSADIRSGRVTGTHTAPEALRALLAGTGVTAHFIDATTVTLRPIPAPTAQRLAAVEIVAPRRRGYAVPQTTSATKTATPLRDVPQSVSVITRDVIADAGMQSMADVARFIPGVTMGQGEGNRDQPTIRGNNTTADLYVDGVRDDVQYFRDLYNLERVEALKGSNAMIFGRGGGGGVLNRVTKEAGWNPTRELTVLAGSYDARRATLDVGDSFSHGVAGRFNGMVERSDLFRRGVSLERYGINPTLTIAPGARRTRIALGYELFSDYRTADRGIPSFAGRPVDSDVATFFGDPDASWSDLRSHAAMATVTHDATGSVTIRNRTQVAAYDKFYQNVFPGSVNAAGDQVSISAYNNATERLNLFNQTDVTLDVTTGGIRHTLLVGAEIGRQSTDTRRLTGYFDNTATSVTAPVSHPTISRPVTFRASATDANNTVENTVASLYVQDQLELTRHLQVIAGMRLERFDLEFHDRREGRRTPLARLDVLPSPRLGIVVKPIETLSLYASHGISHLPSSGDQFASLDTVTTELEPERFRNDEIGAKWDAGSRFSVTGAVYRLDRTNTRASHPTLQGVVVQTGRQRSSGWELTASGALTSMWDIVAGYANQRATIVETTSAAATGARVPLVPRTTASLWNRMQLGSHIGLGVGLTHRSDMFTGLDNAVTLPGYTEVDGALFLRLGRHLRGQVNVDNVLDLDHYSTAHNNNNISPGTPRSFRVSLTTLF